MKKNIEKIIDLLLSQNSETFFLGLKMLEEDRFCEKLKPYNKYIVANTYIGDWRALLPLIINYFIELDMSRSLIPMIIYSNKNGIRFGCSRARFLDLVKFYYEHTGLNTF